MTFKFEIKKCPQCGHAPVSILESVLCDAFINEDYEGGFDYAGESEIAWDTQETQIDSELRCYLMCPQKHTWYTDYEVNHD